MPALRVTPALLLSLSLLAFARASHSQPIEAIHPDELALVQPLLERGAVIIPRGVDLGVASRCTIYVLAQASAAVVLDVVSHPEAYPTFMPAVREVAVLSRHAGRAAFRFRANVSVFDVEAEASLHVVSDRRVDFAIEHSDFGPSGSRWELFPIAPDRTVIALTLWTDPSHANWVVRRLSDSTGYGASGANITAETVLALAVKRRAEVLSGAALPVRPPHPSIATPMLGPPTIGPWLALADTVNVVVLDLAPDGSLAQVTAVGATTAPVASLEQRLLTPESYGAFWSWMRGARVIDRAADRVRFAVSLSAPLGASHGEVIATAEPVSHTVRLDGVSGDFVGEHHRWDLVERGGRTYVLYTGGAETAHLAPIQRAIADREPWAIAGMTAYWNVVMVRFGLAGLI